MNKSQLTKYTILSALLGALFLSGCAGEDDGKKVHLPKSQSPGEAPVVKINPAGPPAERASGPAGAATMQVFSGAVEATRTTSVATRVSGLVREVHVTEGDHVKKGDVLVEIDTEDYRLRVESAKATLERVQAQVAALKVQHDRAAKLLERQAIPQSDFDNIDGQLMVARASIREAEVGLRMARSLLADAQIRAPYDGVVTSVSVAKGAFAAAGPSALLSLEESSALRVRVQLPEQFVRDVKVGSTLRVRASGEAEETAMVVTQINPSINPRSRSFAALAEIKDTSKIWRAGMFVEARLTEVQP